MINKEFINTKLKEVEDEFNEIDKNNLKVKNYFTRGTSNLFSVISEELGIKI